MNAFGLREGAFAIFERKNSSSRNARSPKPKADGSSTTEDPKLSQARLERLLERHQRLERLSAQTDALEDAEAKKIGRIILPFVDRLTVATPALLMGSKKKTREWAANVVGNLDSVNNEIDVTSIRLQTVIPEETDEGKADDFMHLAEGIFKQANKAGVSVIPAERIVRLAMDKTLSEADRPGPWSAAVIESVTADDENTTAILALTDRHSFAEIGRAGLCVGPLAGRIALTEFVVDAHSVHHLSGLERGRPLWSSFTGNLIRS
jgi:hypothetical protein